VLNVRLELEPWVDSVLGSNTVMSLSSQENNAVLVCSSEGFSSTLRLCDITEPN
jgi:hypothetical protein